MPWPFTTVHKQWPRLNLKYTKIKRLKETFKVKTKNQRPIHKKFPPGQVPNHRHMKLLDDSKNSIKA